MTRNSAKFIILISAVIGRGCSRGGVKIKLRSDTLYLFSFPVILSSCIPFHSLGEVKVALSAQIALYLHTCYT